MITIGYCRDNAVRTFTRSEFAVLKFHMSEVTGAASFLPTDCRGGDSDRNTVVRTNPFFRILQNSTIGLPRKRQRLLSTIFRLTTWTRLAVSLLRRTAAPSKAKGVITEKISHIVSAKVSAERHLQISKEGGQAWKIRCNKFSHQRSSPRLSRRCLQHLCPLITFRVPLRSRYRYDSRSRLCLLSIVDNSQSPSFPMSNEEGGSLI